MPTSSVLPVAQAAAYPEGSPQVDVVPLAEPVHDVHEPQPLHSDAARHCGNIY